MSFTNRSTLGQDGEFDRKQIFFSKCLIIFLTRLDHRNVDGISNEIAKKISPKENESQITQVSALV